MCKLKFPTYLTFIAICLAMLIACAKEQSPAALDVGTNPDLAAHFRYPGSIYWLHQKAAEH